MYKQLILSIVICFAFCNTEAQFSRYVVQLKDKVGTRFTLSDPSKYLSPRAIQRRQKQSIAIDESDLPVSPAYIDSVRAVPNVIVIDASKWLNQLCIETSDPNALEKINHFSFVAGTQPVKRLANNNHRQSDRADISRQKMSNATELLTGASSPAGATQKNVYGYSFGQINIHNGEYLHSAGFRGQGMLIAIIDAGFYHYLSLPAFDSVNLQDRVVDTYDFVANESSVNEDHLHGMECFSIIAGNIPGEYVGSAPSAQFLLYRSEDVNSESPVEEQYWIAAAERADSAGADIISTSLGYSTFDNPAFDYSYADMNGHTSMIAKAATIAARKGMIVLAAAGNEGNTSWHYITTPADADSILSVAAVDTNENVGVFSSYGPASDGRVDPTSASVGVGTVFSATNGGLASGNGTSFATPNLAGLVTCLWQAFPDFSNIEIISAVEKSSSIYSTPDDRIGYGIPDFKKAFTMLADQRLLKNAQTILENATIKAFPNPFQDAVSVLVKPKRTSSASFSLYDAAGKLCYKFQSSLSAGISEVLHFNIPNLQNGMYILLFNDGKNRQSLKLVRQ